MNTKLKARFSALRKERNLSLESEAKALGVSTKELKDWENGHANPESEYLQKLADLFDVSVDDLKALDSSSPPSKPKRSPARKWIMFAAALSMLLVVLLLVDLPFLSPSSQEISVPTVPSNLDSSDNYANTQQQQTNWTFHVYLAFIPLSQNNVSTPEAAVSDNVNLLLEDSDFAKVADYIPDIAVDLKYATEDNPTGQVIYDFSEAYLRYGTIKKLTKVQTVLKYYGYSLLIWDAYRPKYAQFKLWEVCPNSTYIANPNTGNSSHIKGNTIDLTMVDMDGKLAVMPSNYDEFSTLADRNYSDVSASAAANAQLLDAVMTANGFTGYSAEWWHYTDTTAYPVDENFNP